MDTTEVTRTARCSSCGREEPSSPALSLFQDRSQPKVNSNCVCGSSGLIHHRLAMKALGAFLEPLGRRLGALMDRCSGPTPCTDFRPVPEPQDRWYCGCRGWE